MINLAYIRDGKSNYMNYKDLIFYIKSCYCKHFSSNQLHPVSGEKNLGDNIWLLTGLSVIKLDLNGGSGEKEYSTRNIYANICLWESFFKEIRLSDFAIHLEQGNEHPESFKPVAINFLSINVGLANGKA